MPRGRLVLGALIALLAVIARGSHAAVVEFASPRAGELVAGATVVELRVDDAASVSRIDVYADGRLIGAATAPDWTVAWTAPSDAAVAEMTAAAYRASELVGRAKITLSAHAINARVDVVAVQLYPVVRRGNRYVGDLDADDFVILEEGLAVPIESFARRPASLEVALVLDISASMEDTLTFVQQAAARLLSRLDDGDRAAVYAFDHALVPVVTATTDHDAARRAVLEFAGGGGGTALHDALLLILDGMRGSQKRKVILLFSDGQDQASITAPSHVAARARESEAIVYAIASAAPGAGRADLELLTSETGGELKMVSDPTELADAFARILTDVKSQYAIAFTPRPGESGIRSLEVRTRQSGYRVRCRRSYHYRADDR